MRAGGKWMLGAVGAVGLALAPATAGAEERSAAGATGLPEQALAEPKPTLTTESGRLLVGGDASGALAKAEAAVKAEPRSGVAQYYRAEALSELKQYQAAITAYDAAVAQLPASEVSTRSQVAWGKGLALRELGRCDEAKKAFNEYATLALAKDAAAASQAQQTASACRPAETAARK